MSRYTGPRSGGQAKRELVRARGGFSLVETLVAVAVLGAGMLGVASVGTSVVRQMGMTRADVGLWASLQTVGDSLHQLGYADVTAGSRTMGRYSVSWSVDTSKVFVDRVVVSGRSTGRYVVADTLIIYVGELDAPGS